MEKVNLQAMFDSLGLTDTCTGADRRTHVVFTTDGDTVTACENIEHYSDRPDKVTWTVSFTEHGCVGRTAESYEEACRIADQYAHRMADGATAHELTQIMRDGAKHYWGE